MSVEQKRMRWPLHFLLAFLLCSFTQYTKAADWYVSTTGTDAPGNGTPAAPFKTIGYAVTKAAAGDVIRIGAGTFIEQVNVGKPLSLIGQGAAQTIIKAPAALTKSFSTTYPPTNSDYYAVVYAHDADNINVNQLTVDGAANGNGFQEFIGVGYLNAGGTVNNCRVISITNNPPYSSNYGLGLYAYAGAGTARSVTVSASYFTNYQKSAMLFYGANLTVNIDGNTIEGAGTIAQIAQNGIQLSFNAKGIIKNNTISKIAYKGTGTFTASGVLVQDAGSGIVVANNTFTNCQLSVYLINAAMAKVTGNRITNNPADLAGTYYYWGIVLNNGDAEVAFNEIDNGGSGLGIDGNTGAANQSTKLNAHNNIVKNAEFGITIERDNDTTGSKVTATVNCNSITITQTLLYNNQPQVYMYAVCNWLGTITEADILAHLDGLITYKPYLLNGLDLLPLQVGFQPAPSTSGCTCSNLTLTVKSKKDVVCYGENDGTATITVAGGTAPYMYSLDGSDFLPVTGTEFTVTDLTAGTHNVIVKDNVGNAQQVTFAISQPATALDATLTSDVNVKCNGASTGSITIAATGGKAPYTIVGRPEPAFTSTITLTNLAAGEYAFVIKDANGCTDLVLDTLLQPTKITVSATTPTPACNGASGSVTITATGGTAPYSGTGVKSNLAPGTYTFKVTDANLCEASITVTISGTGAGTFNPLPETFPNAFNTSFYTSLVNKTFVGSSGTWTVCSDDHASVGVVTPCYSPSSSYALTIANFKTTGCGDGWSKSVSPKLNLTGPCCPNGVKFNFTLWTYAVVCNDTKASLSIDFSSNDGSTWTEVWSKTSAQLFTAYGANGKAMINIPVPVAYQNANFRYRIRGEMEAGDCNNFYVFIDDINIDAPASCAPVGSIGDFVWNDKNGNGKQDPGAEGIAGVTVKLTYPDGSVATKTTDATGHYLFSNLPAGNYTVTFTTPSGYVPTASNVGTDETIDSDPVNGSVGVPLAAGQNNLNIDAGFKVPVCTNTVNGKETFPNKFNTNFNTSLYNSTFTGSTGTWTTNSNSKATMVVTTPYYSPSTSYALKVVNYSTSGCGSTSGWTKAVSPKVDLSAPCCPSELKMSFTLWTYKVVCNDYKADLSIDFSCNNGATWTEVWSKSSAQLYYYYGCNGKTAISIAIPAAYQNANFRYRIRGEMETNDCNNFYVFMDDILIGSPATCGSSSSCSTARTGEPLSTSAEASALSANATAADKAENAKGAFAVNVFPNPTANAFELRLTSKSTSPVSVRVVDVMGRVVKTITTGSNQSIHFGAELKSGSYVAEVVQDDRKEVIKLLKL